LGKIFDFLTLRLLAVTQQNLAPICHTCLSPPTFGCRHYSPQLRSHWVC